MHLATAKALIGIYYFVPTRHKLQFLLEEPNPTNLEDLYIKMVCVLSVYFVGYLHIYYVE